jgi:stage III sporulation protein AE
MVRRIGVVFLILILSIQLSSVNAFASEESAPPDEYKDFLDSLPDDIADLLPEELFYGDMNSIAQGTVKLTSWDYVFDVVFDVLGLNVRTILKTLATVLGMLILCSLLNMIKNSISNVSGVAIINLICGMITVITVIQISRDPLQRAMQLVEEIKVFTNTISPLICSMYAMGGNVSSALVHNYGLIVFLSILENVCIISLEAIFGVCLGLTVASSFIGETNILPLSNAIKKAFTFFLGMIMLIFTTVISTQTLIASKADSLSTKTAKMLATQMIPLVGGTVGESLRTAGASIEYLRTNVGIVLIVVLLLMVLPTFISIGLYRLGFIISNAFAGLLGCEREGKILLEISSIYGYVLAIISISSIILLLLITVFAKCSSPLL